jgi:hypothetical protein
VIDRDGFRDLSGHLSDAGHARVAALLREPVERLLAQAPATRAF